ncbi:hypothetical protein SLEP1_g39199 [Rubroshorea leprosula]|uniref:Uncharacterized protein n=1 Tax=Rubroshorea leprosula TaxID=152421 RepID=A0AAV5KZX9_9ROSI|nr:hypothetical protein SLEP1_g39199 [Rubroshorea leprosula]
MGETANHGPPPQPQVPPSPLALSRGPTWVPAEQLPQLEFCIHSNPSLPQAFLLAFQHYIVMLGTTVLIANLLVPRMGGTHGDKARVIQTLLLMSGVNTLLQTLFGSRLPTVMGASFAYMLPVFSIINGINDENNASEHQVCKVLIGYYILYYTMKGMKTSVSKDSDFVTAYLQYHIIVKLS